MKKMMILSVKRKIDFRYILQSIKNNSSIIMFFIIFLCGLIIGTTLVYVFSDSQLLIIDLFLYSKNGLTIFIKNLIMYSSIYISLFVLGLCSVGATFILCCNILTGIYYGCIFTLFYLNPEAFGILQFMLLKLPSAIIFVITMFLASDIAIQMSSAINSVVFTNFNNYINIKNYIIKFIILQMFGVAASLLDVVVALLYNKIII